MTVTAGISQEDSICHVETRQEKSEMNNIENETKYLVPPSDCISAFKHKKVAVPPKDVRLSDIIETIPKEEEYVESFLVCSSFRCGFSIGSIFYLPITLVYSSLAWFYTGTAWTGLFVIAHDCGHRAFAKSRLVNDIVGTVALLPLIYPFEPWRIQHNIHHQNTNLLDVDNAWQPFQTNHWEEATTIQRLVFRTIKGPMWWFASIGHWLKYHFNIGYFKESQKKRVLFSCLLVAVFFIVMASTLIYTVGFTGFAKYWLVPWIVYHFWMSTFTMIHHTAPHIPFLTKEEWTNARASIGLTVHCDYPKWVVLLCHNINVHIPHHVSTQIPMYNLWKAHDALKKKWSPYMHEATFGWTLLSAIIRRCHIYDDELTYVSFPKKTFTDKSE
eukprot:jgi/Galph1/1758/GphlegSOOS_G446.1